MNPINPMNSGCIEIVIWGRGGQGAKTAGDLLTLALYRAGWKPQGQPRYSADRMGAPVTYAIRYNEDRSPVWDRSRIRNPRYAILFDLALLEEQDLTAAWSPMTTVLANARPEDPAIRRLATFRTGVLDASRIASECGLMKGNVPVLSSVMPGAFAAVSRLLSLEVLEGAIPEARGPISRYPEPNLRAMRAGCREVRVLEIGTREERVQDTRSREEASVGRGRF